MSTVERSIGPIGQIPKGEGRAFEVEGHLIAVFHTHDGGVYATQPFCPHRHGPLADGLVGGTVLMCPLHDRTFDLKTGCGLSNPEAGLETYPARIAPDGVIWLIPSAEATAA
jgi:nitrite reductase (NADH) small subunit